MRSYQPLVLCLFSSLILCACEQSNPPQQQSERVTQVSTLSQNNIADLTADIAALQSLQAFKFSQDEYFQKTPSSAEEKLNFAKQYDHELNELELKSIEANRYRTQLKSFIQLSREYQQNESQKDSNQTEQKELKQKQQRAQIELENTYRQMEKTISASHS